MKLLSFIKILISVFLLIYKKAEILYNFSMEEKIDEIEEKILNILLKECEMKIDTANLSREKRRWIINTLMLMRADESLSEDFLALQDKLLLSENKANLLDLTTKKFFGQIHEENGDLLNSNAELLVVITNSYMDENFNQTSLMSRLILKGGLELKQDIFILKRKNEILKNRNEFSIIPARNLNAKNVLILRLEEQDNLPYFIDALDFIFDYTKKNNVKNIGVIVDNFNFDFDILKEIKRAGKKNKRVKIFYNRIDN